MKKIFLFCLIIVAKNIFCMDQQDTKKAKIWAELYILANATITDFEKSEDPRQVNAANAFKTSINNPNFVISEPSLSILRGESLVIDNENKVSYELRYLFNNKDNPAHQ